MKNTETVNPDYKKLREQAGLTLEALAARINYSVAAVNGLENNDQGSKRLRQIVFETLTGPVGTGGLTGPGEGAAPVEIKLALERARAAEEKLDRVYELVAELFQILSDEPQRSQRGRQGSSPGAGTGATRQPANARRARLRDIESVSLQVLGSIPAGWPQDFDDSRYPARQVQVPRGRFPKDAIGLDVRGDSMNAAGPEPILDGETVVLLPRKHRDPRHNDIVAALCDGQTTLKRLWCPPGEKCVLRAESSNPAFARDIVPAHDFEIQGVVVGKL